MTKLPPCPDNWDACGWCGAGPNETCLNPDLAPSDTTRHPDFIEEPNMAIGADLGGRYKYEASLDKLRERADASKAKRLDRAKDWATELPEDRTTQVQYDYWVTTGLGPKPPKPTKSQPKDTNPKSAAARSKVSLSLVPSIAILELAQAFRDGAAKYGPYNWREDPVSSSVYLDAAFRHMELYRAGQDIASDSGIKHIVHAMSCFAILLDAKLVGTLIDDRDKMKDPSLLEAFLEDARIHNEG
jgi:hypothetical protein